MYYNLHNSTTSRLQCCVQWSVVATSVHMYITKESKKPNIKDEKTRKQINLKKYLIWAAFKMPYTQPHQND